MKNISIILLFANLFANYLLAQNNTDQHIRNAQSYYWLSRSRNNSAYEARIALQYLDSAETTLGDLDADSVILEQIQKEKNDINALIEVSVDNINGYYPIFMHLNQETQHQYEVRDDAIETAIESGLDMLLNANTNKTNKPLKDLVSYCMIEFSYDVPCNVNENILREVVRQYLSNHSSMYVLSEYESHSVSNGAGLIDTNIRTIGKAINSNNFGVFNITLKNVNAPLKYVGVGFNYYDAKNGNLISDTYVEAFKEDKNNWIPIYLLSYNTILFVVLLLLIPFIAWLLFRKKDQNLKKPNQIKPLILSLITGFILGIGTLQLAVFSLSFISPNSDAFIGEPFSIAWPFIFGGFTFILIPQIIFLTLPLITEKLFLKNYRDTFTLLCSMYLGIFFSFQLEFFKFFESAIDIKLIFYGFILILVISYFLANFYINYYKLNLSYSKLYDVPIILILSIPLTTELLKSTPNQSIELDSLGKLLISSVPFAVLLVFRKWITVKEFDEKTTPKTKIEALQGIVKRQLMDYSPNKIYSPFNPIHFDQISENILSLDNKLSLTLITGKSGIGKTSLIHAIKRTATDNFAWFYGDCDEYPENKNIPYEPFYQAFHENEFNESIYVDAGTFYSSKASSADFLKKASPAIAMLPGLNINADALIDSVSSNNGELSEAKVESIINDFRIIFHEKFKDLDKKVKVNLILDDLQWIDSLSKDLTFDFLQLINEIADSIPMFYFHLICISTNDTNNDSITQELHRQLKETCYSWEIKNFNVSGSNTDELQSTEFCSEYLTLISNSCSLNIDTDLIDTIQKRVNKESLNARNTIEVLDKLLNSNFIGVDDDLIIQKESIDWNKVSIKDKEKENFFLLFKSLNPELLKYLSSAAYVGMEFEASILSKLWHINRLDLLHLLLEAENKGIIYDKNDQDDYYVFTSKKVRSSLRSFIAQNSDENAISQIVRDYHFSLLKIELNMNEINEDTISHLREKNSFLLQKASERCVYIEDSHFTESTIIYMVTALKLYEEGKFDRAHIYIEKIPEDSLFFEKHPILMEIRISQVKNNANSDDELKLIRLYDFLFNIFRKHLNSTKNDKRTTSVYLDKLLEFNKSTQLHKFNFDEISTYPQYLHGLIKWYGIYESGENRGEIINLEDLIFNNPDIANQVKAKYSNSILGLLTDNKKQLELLIWRFCFITDKNKDDINSFETLIKAYSSINLSHYNYQQTEDLAFLGGSLFRIGNGQTSSHNIQMLGHKRILLNQIIGSRDGEYLSTLDLLNYIQDDDKTIDLIEQYTELIRKFRSSKGENIENKVVFIYLDLLCNQIVANPLVLENKSIDPIHQMVLDSIKIEPFKLQDVFIGIQEATRKKILRIKAKAKNKKIKDILTKIE